MWVNCLFIEGSTRILIAGLCATTIVACGLVLGLKDGNLTAPQDAGGDGPPVDTRPVLTPDASTATCEGGVARNIQADSDSVYVQLQGSTIESSCGTRADPCGTIAVGLAVAGANRAKAIYIGPGSYAESLSIPSGVSVEGGFSVSGDVWTPLCENITTKIIAPSNVAVDAENVLNAAIRFLTIETKDHGAPNESLFGVRVNSSQLTLENVNVYAELAGPGANGNGGQGTDSTETGCSGSGGAGTTGTAGASGTFDDNGYNVGASGGVGTSGDRGAGGAYTAAACSNACVPTNGCSFYTYPTDDADVPVDDAGNEITDGATGQCSVTTTNVCGGDVIATCGGQGGVAGDGGGGGAASIAVFAVGATTNLTIAGGALVTAGGGLGGAGGPGANGANGDTARNGQPAECDTCDMTCSEVTQSPLSGASSTAGQSGGAGGAGGGGAGGPTYLVVALDNATVVTSQTGQWQTPTNGAPGGSPNGPAGAFGAQYTP